MFIRKTGKYVWGGTHPIHANIKNSRVVPDSYRKSAGARFIRF